jgi:hypothetical protein
MQQIEKMRHGETTILGEVVGAGQIWRVAVNGETKREREKWSAVTTIGVELIGCRDPSASWPARQTAARKKKPATSVGMTE